VEAGHASDGAVELAQDARALLAVHSVLAPKDLLPTQLISRKSHGPGVGWKTPDIFYREPERPQRLNRGVPPSDTKCSTSYEETM
jgi:hypothetical protein